MESYYTIRFDSGPFIRTFPDGRQVPVSSWYVTRGKAAGQSSQVTQLTKELAEGLAKRYAHRKPVLDEHYSFADDVRTTFAQVNELTPVVAFERSLLQAIRELGQDQVTQVIENQLKVNS